MTLPFPWLVCSTVCGWQNLKFLVSDQRSVINVAFGNIYSSLATSCIICIMLIDHFMLHVRFPLRWVVLFENGFSFLIYLVIYYFQHIEQESELDREACAQEIICRIECLVWLSKDTVIDMNLIFSILLFGITKWSAHNFPSSLNVIINAISPYSMCRHISSL